MAILAYDDAMLREPRLLLPRGRRFTAYGQYWGIGGTANSVPFRYDGPLTLSCWVYPRAVGTYQTIMALSKASDYVALFTLDDSLGAEAWYWPWNESPSVSSGNKLLLNSWNHVATTMDVAHWAVYLNGIPNTLTVTGWKNTTGWDRFSVGAMWYGAGIVWQNTICDIAGVSVHNERLSPSHIKMLANGAPPDKFPGYFDHWPLFANSPGFEFSRNRKLRLAGTAPGSTAPDDIRIMSFPT